MFFYKKEVSFNTFKYIKPSNIELICVDKITENDALYVYTLENLKLFSLNEVVEEYADIKVIDITSLFQINEEVLFDTSNIKIDAS